ncbi:MAG TPA: mechanosensitive ion channel domain-containing protein [Methanocella sp.]|nr:mechanosensitive ion channel domain-containing protein [Methanocella sp.]
MTDNNSSVVSGVVSGASASTSPMYMINEAMLFLAGFLYYNWHRLLLSLFILALAYLVIRLVKGLIFQLGKDYGISDRKIRTLAMLATYTVLTIAFVNILAVFDVQLFPLILSLGVLSVVVVLGSQLLISNMLGGVVVYIEKPFAVSDLIRVGDNMGTVQSISIRATTLKGQDGLAITVPNSTFLTTPIINYTSTKRYRVEVSFTMPRNVDLAGLVDAVWKDAATVPGFIAEIAGQLYKTGISEGGFNYELRFWVSDPRKTGAARSRVIDIINDFYPETPGEESASKGAR